MSHSGARGPVRLILLAPPWYEVPPAGYGGIEEMLAELCDQLIGFGHDVTLVGAGRSATGARSHSTYDKPQGERIGESVVEVAHAAAAQRVIEELRPDLVHDHTLAGPLAAPARPVPTLVTAHGPVNQDYAMYYGSLGSAIGLAAISHAQRRTAPELPWVATVHNAVALHRYTCRSRREKEDYALVLGRCTPDKGIDTAILAARAAGRRTVLALKCSERGEQDYFDAAIRPLLGPDVDYVGEASAEEKTELLGRAGCLLFPVRWEEPFGMVAIEAMACGTPVVAFRRGALPETVVDGVTGVLADREAELPAAVDTAMELDPGTCREHVCRNFTGETMARGYERAYLSFLDRVRDPVEHGPHEHAGRPASLSRP
ncbi:MULTISPECIES: glycosyltransferase family 4 protein [Nocardiopsis]|uniref:Glycosyltransferase n=1 Tax=Nocardiopsis sinuspersici TaxID=501010 RepID=A0A1V3BZG6_9ACTN|nr:MULTISPECIES: glycosyltransferase family 4 protein [Nocardiopsis]NYH55067.1 glycosyltransferase involved in cell wall biosynthesis [Nocardiopsis sinuspersici]OOC53783.1 glycosyltransferase [Nocardiopsis sinuspersici]